MPTCPTCGYESFDMARFCRQCGGSLPADGDPMEATTRSYGKKRQVVAGASSTQLPPSIVDAVAGETARYQQPFASSPPAYSPPSRVPPPANTASLRSRKRRFLKWGGFVLAILMSGGLGAAINQQSNNRRIYVSSEDRARLERLRAEDQVRLTLTGSVAEQQEQVRREVQNRLEAVQRAREEAQRVGERGELIPTDEKPLDLTQYEYQGASAGQFSRIPGRELLTQRTKDDFMTVTRFYQAKLGSPFAQVNERNERQALFQSAGSPSVTVLVRESRDRSRQLEIIVLRSPFRFSIAQPVDAQETDGSLTGSKQKVVR
jgi:hypothetical protein